MTWTWPGSAGSASPSTSPCATARSSASGRSTTPRPCGSVVSLAEDGYQQSIALRAGRERVWDAVGTAAGPRHWWTTTVTGSADEGGELRFGFAGLPEEMTMLVVSSRRPASVTWRCVAHSRDQEWTGTELSFELADRGPGRCEL